MTESGPHKLTIGYVAVRNGINRLWRARCSCGWSAPAARDWQYHARQDGEAHLEAEQQIEIEKTKGLTSP